LPTQTQLLSRPIATLGLAIGLACAALVTPTRAQAQHAAGDVVLHEAFGFLNTGGYFFTAGSAQHALGNPKFYSAGTFYVRPKNYGRWTLTGGVETMGASDHFFPFMGGNEFSLIGASFRISTPRHMGRVSPFFSAGVFAGHIRSEDLNIKTTHIIPSMAIGVQYPISKIFSLSASYRISPDIAGINTDGFSISLRIF